LHENGRCTCTTYCITRSTDVHKAKGSAWHTGELACKMYGWRRWRWWRWWWHQWSYIRIGWANRYPNCWCSSGYTNSCSFSLPCTTWQCFHFTHAPPLSSGLAIII
jgi:hypothetical protein